VANAKRYARADHYKLNLAHLLEGGRQWLLDVDSLAGLSGESDHRQPKLLRSREADQVNLRIVDGPFEVFADIERAKHVPALGKDGVIEIDAGM